MIIRQAERTAFTMVPNSTVEDARLSFRARGVLTWLLSKPDDWHVDREGIAHAGTEGVSAVRTALNELAEYGYLRRQRHQVEGGKWVTEVWVYESPMADYRPSVDRPSVSQPLIPSLLVPKTRSRAHKRKMKVPRPFEVTDAMWAWADENVPGVNVELETENFLDHFDGKGELRLDWVATWRTWMRNAKKWQRQPSRSLTA